MKTKYPVLIIGADSTGLMMAVQLALTGISFRIIQNEMFSFSLNREFLNIL